MSDHFTASTFSPFKFCVPSSDPLLREVRRRQARLLGLLLLGVERVVRVAQ
jgi:hypothetical protein